MQNDSQYHQLSRISLRLALSQKGKQRIERIISEHQPITVGTRESCTFCVEGPGIPESIVVLNPAGGLYQLHLQHWMKGWVILDQAGGKNELPPTPDNSNFQHLQGECLAQLTPASQGKITLGTAALLFQFIEEMTNDEDENEDGNSTAKDTKDIKNEGDAAKRASATATSSSMTTSDCENLRAAATSPSRNDSANASSQTKTPTISITSTSSTSSKSSTSSTQSSASSKASLSSSDASDSSAATSPTTEAIQSRAVAAGVSSSSTATPSSGLKSKKEREKAISDAVEKAKIEAQAQMESELSDVRAAAAKAAQTLESVQAKDQGVLSEIDQLKAQLEALQRQLVQANERRENSAAAVKRAQADFITAKEAEATATRSAQLRMEKAIEKRRQEIEEILNCSETDASSSTVVSSESASASASASMSTDVHKLAALTSQGNPANLTDFIDSDNEDEDDDDEDLGPLVLPDYSVSAVPKDPLFAQITGILLLLNLLAMTAILTAPMPEPAELTLEDIPERFASVIMPDKPKDEPVSEKQNNEHNESSNAEKKAAAPSKDPKPTGEALKGKQFANATERKAAIRQGVQGKGLLKILGSAGGDGFDGDAIEDVLGGGSSSGNDIAAALAGAGGVGVATSESIARQAGQRLGGGGGTAASIGDLGTQGGASATATKIEEKKKITIRGRVIDEGPDVDSAECDKNAIARYVKGRMRAIQGCYEKELKKNTSLKGKLVVSFTINEKGKVVGLSIEEDTIGNNAVIACIRNNIRMWNFPIKDVECPVVYPFIFSPGT